MGHVICFFRYTGASDTSKPEAFNRAAESCLRDIFPFIEHGQYFKDAISAIKSIKKSNPNLPLPLTFSNSFFELHNKVVVPSVLSENIVEEVHRGWGLITRALNLMHLGIGDKCDPTVINQLTSVLAGISFKLSL